MRRAIAVSTALLTLLVTAPVRAQNYTGTYLLQAPSRGTVTLSLRQDGSGKATGTMRGNGVTFQLAGQLRSFLLSSAWCSFSYNQTTGTSRSSRNVFLPNGILMIGTNREGGTVNQNGGGNVDLGGGASGSYYSQSQGGQQARWQVQAGQLSLDLGQGMQAVAMQITRNSNGHPITTASGTEYTQCQ